ncbi:MAG: SAM-dependent methyltransferase, partial [Proteobacteria bacterium]
TEGVRYVASPAEQIPLPDGAFDLITVSLAFHWFDRPAFFTEANRLLRTNGYLVIYNNAFYGAMRENSGFQNWLIEEFLIRYPTPSRNNIAVTDMEVHPYGLRFLQDQKYENEVVFTVEELASYLVTQSNVIVAVEQGKEKAEAVYDWIVQQATSFFSTAKGTFLFGGYITIGANRD